MKRVLAIAFLCLALAALPAHALELYGGVVDYDGEGLSDVGVTFRPYNAESDSVGEPVGTVYTDDDGYFLFTNVVAGSYRVELTLAGYPPEIHYVDVYEDEAEEGYGIMDPDPLEVEW